jgi:hypothetical protein
VLEHLGACGAGGRWCLCQAGDLELTWPQGLSRAPGKLGFLLCDRNWLLLSSMLTHAGLFNSEPGAGGSRL